MREANERPALIPIDGDNFFVNRCRFKQVFPLGFDAGQKIEGLKVFGLLFQHRLHLLPGFFRLPAQQVKRAQLELGIGIFRVEFGYHGVGLESPLWVPQPEVCCAQAGIGFQSFGIDLDGVSELQFGVFKFTLLDKGFPFFQVGSLLLGIRLARRQDQNEG